MDAKEVLARLDIRAFFSRYGIEPTNDYQHSEWQCRCPWHDDRSPSLAVNVETGLYRCFGCGEKGDVFTLYMRENHCNFKEAVKRLGEEVGLMSDGRAVSRPASKPQSAQSAPPPSNPPRPTIPHEVAEQWHHALLDNLSALNGLMQKRMYTMDTIKRFRLGYIEEQKRVSIPIYDEAGQLINIRRYSPSGRKPKFLPYGEGFGTAALFPIENVTADEILLVEGEPDCMLACQLGYAGLTQTGGAGTWKPEWTELLKGKKIHICYDVDAAGRAGAQNVAKILTRAGCEVRNIVLPVTVPGKDFTDYIREGYGKDDVDRLITETPVFISEELPGEIPTSEQSTVDIDEVINSLPDRLVQAEHYDALKRIYRAMASMPPTRQEQYINLLKERFGLRKGAIRDELRLIMFETKIEPVIPEPLEAPRRANICLAQDMVDGIFHYCIWLPTNKGEFVPRLVRSDRTLEPIPEELEDRIPADTARWSVDSQTPYNVFEWLNNSRQVDPRQLFEDLRSHLRRFLWYPDERTYTLIPLWWMSTYIFMTFDAVGYLALVGTKRSGKTLLIDVTEQIAFNATSFSSGSDAYVFRTIEDDRATLLIDEADQLQRPPKEGINEKLEITRGGYKRSGKVGRIEKNGDGMERRAYSTFSPKLIANVTGLEDALEDRVIHIDVERKPDDVTIEAFHARSEQRRAQEFRNRLYFFGLQCAGEIAKIYDVYRPTEIKNREAEIWAGILCTARFLGEDLYDEVMGLALRNQKRKELREGMESPEAQVIIALWQLYQEDNYVMRGDEHEDRLKYWTAESVRDAVCTQLGWEHYTYNRLSQDLLRLRLIEDDDVYKRRTRIEKEQMDKTGNIKTVKRQAMCYALDERKIRAAAARYKVSLDALRDTAAVAATDEEPW